MEHKIEHQFVKWCEFTFESTLQPRFNSRTEMGIYVFVESLKGGQWLAKLHEPENEWESSLAISGEDLQACCMALLIKRMSMQTQVAKLLNDPRNA